MTLYMETTKITAEKTVAEIQAILGKYGAKSIQVEYEKGEVSAVAFIVEVGEKRLPFVLPCRWEQVRVALYGPHKSAWPLEQKKRDDHAKRVAWRQILRWIEAQMAMTQTKMVKMEEIFMPYLVVGKNHETLFQRLEGSQFLLEAPE